MNNPYSRQIRAELRGRFPDLWTDELLNLLDFFAVQDLGNDDHLKCQVAALFSPTLAQLIGGQQSTPVQVRAWTVPLDRPAPPQLPWQQ